MDAVARGSYVGGAMPKEFVRTNVQAMEDAFHFNVSTAHALTRAALPHLLKGGYSEQAATGVTP